MSSCCYVFQPNYSYFDLEVVISTNKRKERERVKSQTVVKSVFLVVISMCYRRSSHWLKSAD